MLTLSKLIKMHPLKDLWSDKNDTRNLLLIAFLIVVAGILIYLSEKTDDEEADIRIGQSDFTTYCYDYNDVGSSPYLRDPFKIKLLYADLTSPDNVIQTGGTNLSSQPDSSVQIVNNTSQNPLHVFLQCGSMAQRWKKIGGNGEVAPAPIDWGSGCETGSSSCKAFDPLGADIYQEVKVPEGKSLILQIPEGHLTKQGTDAARIFAIHMKNPGGAYLQLSDDNPKNKLTKQQPILVEGGKNVVADMSAVDGINFKVRYELTSDNGKKKVMNILKNPCDGIDSGGMDVGCANPVRTASGCKGTGASILSTAECKPGTQDCKFNVCSAALFNIPDNKKQYTATYDGGNSAHNNYPPVKKFINNATNLKSGTDLKKFCEKIQSDFRGGGGGGPIQPSPTPPRPRPPTPPTPPTPTPSNGQIIKCDPNANPPQLCPGQIQCPSSGVCPGGGARQPSPTPPRPPPQTGGGECPTRCDSGIQCQDGQGCPDGSSCPAQNGCTFRCCP